jgi:hypothetical protein
MESILVIYSNKRRHILRKIGNENCCIGDNKLAVNYLEKFVIKVLFMTPNYVTITITKFHTI